MQSGAFLRHNCVFRQGIRKSCALTSSRLDDFFRYSYFYTVMITLLLGGEGAGHFGGKILPLTYPR